MKVTEHVSLTDVQVQNFKPASTEYDGALESSLFNFIDLL